jgi:predicted DNA binding CopG/RHH family protein
MSELGDLLAAEGDAAEAAENSSDARERTNVKVTRGHDRARTLQIRLNDTELEELNSLAAQRGLPVSTVARQLLLQSLTTEENLESAFDQLERTLSAVRRKALSGQP